MSLKLPKKKFGVIYMDPPWAFKTYAKPEGQVPQRAEEQHYPVMSVDEMKTLPVAEVAAKDCALLMWVVDAFDRQSFELAEHWGFTFKTIALIWDKQRMGMGYWTRKEGEICRLFTRGKPKRQSGGVRQIIRAPRREHSRKPDEAYERIEALLPGPYLEMFSRTDRKGWTSWGNQTGKFNQTSNRQQEYEDVI